jgi:hypothetical protein
MRNSIILAALISVFTFNIKAQKSDVCRHVKILSADSLMGRKPGNQGIEMAATYINNEFKKYGLQPMYQDGLQYFDVLSGVSADDKNIFNYGDVALKSGIDFLPLSYSKDTAIKSKIVFAGFGISLLTDSVKWDDYVNLNVEGKWVIVLRGYPAGKEVSYFETLVSDRSKVIRAKNKGAAGVILVNSAFNSNEGNLIPLDIEKSRSRMEIPVVTLSRDALKLILEPNNINIDLYEKQMNQGVKSTSAELNGVVEISVKLNHVYSKTSNVVALLPATKNSNEYIVIGAHYDHLGMGGYGSGSRKPDLNEVHNGADDNASGVSCILGLAEKMAIEKYNGKYNLIFVAFSGEEMGLLGSAYFVKHLPVNRKLIKLMLNFDMVGRLNDKNVLSCGGVGTFPDAVNLIKSVVDTNEFHMSYQKEGYGPSDHASFYNDSIPVLYLNTGVHQDYHTPSDDFEKINCDGLNKIDVFAAKLIKKLSQGNYDLSFHEAGQKNSSSMRGTLKVTLGIMPDFANQDIKGVLVAAVNDDGPAQRGGIKKGDVIVGMGGNPVNDIYEYMDRLNTLKKGQTVVVDVIRNNKKEVLLIQL